MTGKVLKCPKCGQRWTHGVAPQPQELPFVEKGPLVGTADPPGMARGKPSSLAVAGNTLGLLGRSVYYLGAIICVLFVAFCGFNFAYTLSSNSTANMVAPPRYDRPGGVPSQGDYTILHRHFDAIHEGMTYDKVLAITNRHGEEMASAGQGDMKMSTYSWSNADGSSMVIGFQGGKVISKAQLGLR
jgi:hypothetical protein